jgi:hypothetical protein
MKKLVTLALALLCAAAPTPAQEFTEKQLIQLLREAAANDGKAASAEEQNAQEIFMRILETNYLRVFENAPEENFQGFHLPTLVRDLRTIDFYWNANGILSGSGGTRYSGVHTVSNRRAILNVSTWKRTAEKQRPVLVLHEAIGALGYDDEDYALSLALEWHAKSLRQGKAGARAPFKVKTRQSDQEKFYVARGGGSSIVGGGGDNCEIYIKQLLADAFANEPALLQQALDARVECDGFRVLEVEAPNGRLKNFRIDRVGGRLRVRAQAMLELVGPHYPQIGAYIVSEFRKAGRRR